MEKAEWKDGGGRVWVKRKSGRVGMGVEGWNSRDNRKVE